VRYCERVLSQRIFCAAHGDVIPLTRPRGASNSWTCSSLVNEILAGTRVQPSTVVREMAIGENYERNITPSAQIFRDFREAQAVPGITLANGESRRTIWGSLLSVDDGCSETSFCPLATIQ
jgi:hypothetical protein